jgi:hypothetical protein
MRRALTFCEWKNGWWKDQVMHRTEDAEGSVLSSELTEGLLAYAEEQAVMESALAMSFMGKWRAVRERARPFINKVMGLAPDTDVIMEDAGVIEFLISEEDDNNGGGSDYEE